MKQWNPQAKKGERKKVDYKKGKKQEVQAKPARARSRGAGNNRYAPPSLKASPR
jgi:hypothetical protein